MINEKASNERIIESLKYAQKDLAVANDMMSDLEAEVKRLADMNNEKAIDGRIILSDSHENTIESLKYAREDLMFVYKDSGVVYHDLVDVNYDLINAYDKILNLNAEVKRLTEELNSK